MTSVASYDECPYNERFQSHSSVVSIMIIMRYSRTTVTCTVSIIPGALI